MRAVELNQQEELRIVDYKQIAIKLWEILDDIDTASDMAKGNDKWYRARVEHLQRKRFEHIQSDGYRLLIGGEIIQEYESETMGANSAD